MGHNMVAVILNDALGPIERDPEFGQNVAMAARNWYARDRFSTWASAGGHSHALQIISQDHADGEQVVVVHGNTGQRADEANNLGWHALEQMKSALERHGYKVTKPRKKKN